MTAPAAPVTFEERRKGERPSHHGLGGRKRGVASIHVAKVDLPFVRDGRPAEQHVVFVEESDLYRPLGQRKSSAAALQAAPQDSNTHLSFVPGLPVPLTRSPDVVHRAGTEMMMKS
jgi:hypothetical protein